jgi:hypothetical protein
VGCDVMQRYGKGTNVSEDLAACKLCKLMLRVLHGDLVFKSLFCAARML